MFTSELFCDAWLAHGWWQFVGCSCLQVSREMLGPRWDACPRTHAPVRSHTHALMHQCTHAPAHPCTRIPMHPCIRAPRKPQQLLPVLRGRAVCYLPFSGHGNCRVMKCCQDPGQEQSFVKERKKKKQTRERHDVKPLKSKNPSCLVSHALFSAGPLESSLVAADPGPSS